MLQIRVHHDDGSAARGREPGHQRALMAEVARQANAAHAHVGGAERVDRSQVPSVLPSSTTTSSQSSSPAASQHLAQVRVQRFEIAFLVVRWYHDGNHAVTPKQSRLLNLQCSYQRRAAPATCRSPSIVRPMAHASLKVFDRAARERTVVLPRPAELAPLEHVAAQATGTDILDVGCGHGVLAALLLHGHPERRVVGIDPDVRKIEWANESVGKNPTRGVPRGHDRSSGGRTAGGVRLRHHRRRAVLDRARHLAAVSRRRAATACAPAGSCC